MKWYKKVGMAGLAALTMGLSGCETKTETYYAKHGFVELGCCATDTFYRRNGFILERDGSKELTYKLKNEQKQGMDIKQICNSKKAIIMADTRRNNKGDIFLLIDYNYEVGSRNINVDLIINDCNINDCKLDICCKEGFYFFPDKETPLPTKNYKERLYERCDRVCSDEEIERANKLFEETIDAIGGGIGGSNLFKVEKDWLKYCKKLYSKD